MAIASNWKVQCFDTTQLSTISSNDNSHIHLWTSQHSFNITVNVTILNININNKVGQSPPAKGWDRFLVDYSVQYGVRTAHCPVFILVFVFCISIILVIPNTLQCGVKIRFWDFTLNLFVYHQTQSNIKTKITWTTEVVEPPGTGGRRQFSGLPNPRLPRVTWWVHIFCLTTLNLWICFFTVEYCLCENISYDNLTRPKLDAINAPRAPDCKFEISREDVNIITQ